MNPLEYFAPLAEDGVDDETILMMAISLMNDCDGVLFAPGWKKSRGCRYEHFKLRHSHKDNKYFKARSRQKLKKRRRTGSENITLLLGGGRHEMVGYVD